jgi:glucose-6-phosphate isomerase
MSNFFAQADALAYGKSPQELRSQNVPDYLIPHRTFTGNRPSLSLLLPELNAYTVGQVLALYEHQVAVQVRGVEGGGGKHRRALGVSEHQAAVQAGKEGVGGKVA